MTRVIFIFILFFSAEYLSAQTQEIDSLLLELDVVVDSIAFYDQSKEDSLNKLKELLEMDLSTSNKYELAKKLFDEYIDYNIDSAVIYANKQLNLAKFLISEEKLVHSKLNIAISLLYTGSYKEAESLLQSLNVENYPELKPKYYIAFRRLYGDWSNYSTVESDKKLYEQGVDYYRRKTIEICDPNSFESILALSDELNRLGKFEESLILSYDSFFKLKPNSHQRGSLAFNIALSFKGLNDSVNARKWMIISTINDLKSSIKIYVFLREIAVQQLNAGNVNRAYKYIRRSLDDALFSNARLQSLKTLEMLPVIDRTYQKQNDHNHKLLRILLICLSIFVLILLLTILFIYLQFKKLSKAREELKTANQHLNELNHELYEINVGQKKINEVLSESNIIKEEYIGRFMDQCSIYIDKMDNFRHELEILAFGGKMDDLVRKVKSKDFIYAELKEFYDTFDATFLNLFPDFVDEFNKLLSSPEPVRNDNSLSTELRIFALIRLGITDSVKISHLLRYSLSTIYNYKTKIKHKVLGDKDKFEESVMQIGIK